MQVKLVSATHFTSTVQLLLRASSPKRMSSKSSFHVGKKACTEALSLSGSGALLENETTKLQYGDRSNSKIKTQTWCLPKKKHTNPSDSKNTLYLAINLQKNSSRIGNFTWIQAINYKIIDQINIKQSLPIDQKSRSILSLYM